MAKTLQPAKLLEPPVNLPRDKIVLQPFLAFSTSACRSDGSALQDGVAKTGAAMTRTRELAPRYRNRATQAVLKKAGVLAEEIGGIIKRRSSHMRLCLEALQYNLRPRDLGWKRPSPKRPQHWEQFGIEHRAWSAP